MARLYDMHCHVGSLANANEFARQADRLGITLLNVTVSPADAAACERLANHSNVYRACGLHPWWIANGVCDEQDAARAAALCAASRYVGEIGLDFAGDRAASAHRQLAAFEQIVQACAESPVEKRLLSIHAVRSASCVMDTLQRFNLMCNAACIFHWFSGTSDELARARSMGCYFSINPRMLATKRGREYARQIPLDRILLETDAPAEFGTRGDAAAHARTLLGMLDTLGEIRSESRGFITERIERTSEELLL